MRNVGVFDILGPIMIGPSSSHTAGAARLGKVARTIAGEEIVKVRFLLHGSFAKTYKGHGTDRALIAGILGMEPSDIRLRDALNIAKDKGIDYSFEEVDLGDEHPNTVKFLITTKDGRESEIMGCSIGGGSIKITNVNGTPVDFSGEYPTLIISHKDVPGAISRVTKFLYDEHINIAYMKVFRNQKGKEAAMAVELDHKLDDKTLEEIKATDIIEKVVYINPVAEGE
ncbi:MAG: L-serine ammonia-lyase, iron-sulfur-dependent subunit beta [Clostridium sp.]